MLLPALPSLLLLLPWLLLLPLEVGRAAVAPVAVAGAELAAETELAVAGAMNVAVVVASWSNRRSRLNSLRACRVRVDTDAKDS